MKYINNFTYFQKKPKVIFENNFYFNPTDVFSTFCSLTRKTYPHGTEHEVLKWIKHPLKQDKFNNYFLKIGESETMFASHLDSATEKQENVKLLTFEQNGNKFISTDGKTILGADDKAGVTIMLYMIENKVPGLYYFFIGEERGGLGSKNLANDYQNENLIGIKRCISFDRNGYNSIITHQMNESCCTDLFANAICEEFENNGIFLEKDNTGIFTDSANFINRIDECTNLSVGYFNEHTKKEYQNITYLERLCKACVNINWEKLPKQNLILESVSEILTKIENLKPQLAEVAQIEYNEWEQDEEGIDEFLGSGGICDGIAEKMSHIIHNNGINCASLYNEHDTHTSLYVWNEKEKVCYNVDIAPNNYETGYLYNWTKIPNVIFTGDMVDIIPVEYEHYIDNNGDFINE